MFFSEWFKAKHLPETELEKEYWLLHDVLMVLREAGLSTSRVGSEAGGHIPIYEYSLKTGLLSFAALGAKLNNAPILTSEPTTIMSLQRLKIKEEDVPITRCTWEQLAKAVDTLEAAKEIFKGKMENGMFGISEKTVHLTEEGMYSFNTRKYRSLYDSERDKRRLQNSTLTTQSLTRLFTGIVTASTLVTLSITISDKCLKDNKPTIVIMQAPTTTSKPSLPIHTYKSLPEKKDAADSIPQKK